MGTGWFRRAAAVTALLLAMPGLAADSPPPVPSAADFGALPFLTGPRLSPDGLHLAAEARLRGKTMIVLVDPDAIATSMVKIDLPEKQQLEWYRWAGNGRLLISVSFQTKFEGEDVRATRLVCYELATGKISFVGIKSQGFDGDDVIYVDEAGEYVLLSTQETIYEYPSVFRIDLATGRRRNLVRQQTGVWEWFADSRGVVRAGVGIEGSKWWVIYRADETQNFARTVKRDRDEEDGVDRILPVTGKDKGYAIAVGKTGRFGLYHYDFSTDQLGAPIYENPKYDIDDFDVSPTGEVLSVTYVDDRDRIEWLDPEFKKLQARLDRALPGKANRVVSASRDWKRMLIWSGAADDPGAYYLYDRDKSKMHLLVSPWEKLAGKRLAPMESVSYKARDGLDVPAYLTMPPGKGDKGLPMVVLPHGGPFARDSWSYDGWVQFLASRGYVVLQPNFRGSTGFGRDYVEKGMGQWGRGMQDDIDDGVKWLADRGTVDPKRVCIMGASFGGYAAMWAAVRNPEIYRCAISFAGVSDVGSMLRYDRKSFSASRYFRNWRERVQGDKNFELDTISPLKQVDRMTLPILLAHGTDDDNVPLYQSRRLHEALLKLGRKHDYVAYVGEGHGFADPENSTDFLTRVGAFLDAHNPS